MNQNWLFGKNASSGRDNRKDGSIGVLYVHLNVFFWVKGLDSGDYLLKGGPVCSDLGRKIFKLNNKVHFYLLGKR